MSEVSFSDFSLNIFFFWKVTHYSISAKYYGSMLQILRIHVTNITDPCYKYYGSMLQILRTHVTNINI